MAMVSSGDARLVYRNARRALKAQNVPLGNAILSQGYLRFETVLTQTDTVYKFSILTNQQNAGVDQFPTEVRLQLQDSFYISHAGVFLNVAATAAGNTAFQDYLMSFPSDIFNGAYNPFGMYNFYNGFMSLTINNRVLCPQWDLFKHLNTPQSQNSGGASSTPLDQLDGSQDGFYPVEPNWVLIGSKNNDLRITLPRAFGGTISSANMKIHSVIYFRGVLAQNSTSVR
jgi:hypothetical protein